MSQIMLWSLRPSMTRRPEQTWLSQRNDFTAYAGDPGVNLNNIPSICMSSHQQAISWPMRSRLWVFARRRPSSQPLSPDSEETRP